MILKPGQLSPEILQADPAPTFLSAAEFTSIYQNASKQIIRPLWLLELVVTGTMQVNVAGSGWLDCDVHEGILYAPGASCSERASPHAKPDSPTTSLYIEFGLQEKHPFGQLLQPGQLFIKIEDRHGSLERLLRNLVDAVGGGIHSASIYALGTYYQIMSLLIAAENKGDILDIRQTGLPMPDVIINAHTFMRENLGQPIRLKDIARHVGLSESGFSHAYVRITGRSPLNALRDFRIETARNKILQGSMTLAAIAQETGFSDAFHLSRSFKKIIGMSPREYVKSLWS